MNIFQKAIGKLAAIVNTPQYISKDEMARQMYSRPQTQLARRSWASRVSETLNINGFVYRCQCDEEFAFPDAFEAMKDHHCPVCKDKFVELLKFAGIDPKEVPVNQWQSIFLAKLPRRPWSVDQRRAAGPIKFGDWDSNLPNDDVAAPIGSDGRWV